MCTGILDYLGLRDDREFEWTPVTAPRIVESCQPIVAQKIEVAERKEPIPAEAWRSNFVAGRVISGLDNKGKRWRGVMVGWRSRRRNTVILKTPTTGKQVALPVRDTPGMHKNWRFE